ncbi:unnamed protein product, partial [Urochloa humidicola]
AGGEKSNRARAAGGDGVDGDPVPEREGDPLPLPPVLHPPGNSLPSLASLPISGAASPLAADLFARMDFVRNHYAEIKACNPTVPFLVRESPASSPISGRATKWEWRDAWT